MVLLAWTWFVQPAAPAIDGKIDEAEWAGAATYPLEGGGEVRLLPRGDFLYVAVRGSTPGLASLCAAGADTVRILHASAAIGEARYEWRAGVWTRTADFEWRLRDSPRTGPPAPEAYQQALLAAGWIANPSAAGAPVREFQIRRAGVDAIGVTFLRTSEPMSLAFWPRTMSDDCRTNMRIAQGYVPETAAFDPAQWHHPAR